ncbi:MAG: cytochrome c3 family protein [Pirellulales bacterium]
MNDLPDYVHFHHGIHVQKGIKCTTCHGPIDKMPLTWKASTLHMRWCLDCHRQPENHVGPRTRRVRLGR